MKFDNQRIEDLICEEEYVESLRYIECTFYNCQFLDTKMKNCNFDNCKFINCTFRNLQFEVCRFLNCAFTECNLIGINWAEIQGRSAIFFPAKFMKECVIKYNNFMDMQLISFDFSGSTIHDTYFQECDLTKANFKNVNFSNSLFQNCDLKEADFREAHNYSIDISSNNIKRAKFSYPDVVNLLSTLDIKIE